MTGDRPSQSRGSPGGGVIMTGDRPSQSRGSALPARGGGVPCVFKGGISTAVFGLSLRPSGEGSVSSVGLGDSKASCASPTVELDLFEVVDAAPTSSPFLAAAFFFAFFDWVLLLTSRSLCVPDTDSARLSSSLSRVFVKACNSASNAARSAFFLFASAARFCSRLRSLLSRAAR